MELKQALDRIVRMKEADVGPTEENVKQKIVVPLLELLGHSREDLEFEYRAATGGKIDIYIKQVPFDCKVIIDTKNYKEDLNDHVEQIKTYTFAENALLAVLANGTEIRIYGQLKGVAFERSLLYAINRHDLTKERTWETVVALLGRASLENRDVFTKLNDREREIKEAMSSEQALTEECNRKIEGIESDIETKEEEIDCLKKEERRLEEDLHATISRVWDALGLPVSQPVSPGPYSGGESTDRLVTEGPGKAGRVSFAELVDSNLLKDGEKVYLFYGARIPGEEARIVASQNKLKYEGDGRVYTTSKLGAILLRKHKRISSGYPVQGPKYWQTESGKVLDELNEQVRMQRGDRG